MMRTGLDGTRAAVVDGTDDGTTVADGAVVVGRLVGITTVEVVVAPTTAEVVVAPTTAEVVVAPTTAEVVVAPTTAEVVVATTSGGVVPTIVGSVSPDCSNDDVLLT